MATFIFDLGNVLVFFDHEKIFAHLEHFTGKSKSFFRDLFLKSPLAIDYEHGKLSTKEFHKKFCQKTTLKISYQDFVYSLTRIFEPNDSINPIIENLKKQGHQLLLLSNTCEAHFEYVKSTYPIVSKFHDFILSYKIGYRKPKEEIYREALKLVKHDLNSCYFFDDLEENIDAANLLGIQGIVFKDTKTLQQYLEGIRYAF